MFVSPKILRTRGAWRLGQAYPGRTRSWCDPFPRVWKLSKDSPAISPFETKDFVWMNNEWNLDEKPLWNIRGKLRWFKQWQFKDLTWFKGKQWWFDLADISGFHERKTRDFWNGWLSQKCVGLVLALPPVFARAIATVYQGLSVYHGLTNSSTSKKKNNPSIAVVAEASYIFRRFLQGPLWNSTFACSLLLPHVQQKTWLVLARLKFPIARMVRTSCPQQFLFGHDVVKVLLTRFITRTAKVYKGKRRLVHRTVMPQMVSMDRGLRRF